MTDRILVAVYDCGTEDYLLTEAIRIAKAKEKPVELLLLHVLPDGTSDDKNTACALQQWVDRARASGLTATAQIEYGMPGRIICQQASSPLWGANWIIIGHRTRNALTELALGSVSAYVRRHTPVNCAVLVVRPPMKAAMNTSPSMSQAQR